MFIKGVHLLEFLFENGMSHGQINANSLSISDAYMFTLSDFPLSVVTKNFGHLSPHEQDNFKLEVRGFNTITVSEDLAEQLKAQIAANEAGLSHGEESAAHREFRVAQLIKEDWKDMVTTFYFPRLSKMITEPRLREFIDHTNRELLEPSQEVSQIRKIAAKANLFLMNNIWILEDLIATLKDE